MNTLTIGCIGCGNMGSAILRGLHGHQGYQLYGYNRTRDRALPLEALGVTLCEDTVSLVQRCTVIIVAVKPRFVQATLHDIRKHLRKQCVVISVAAGVSLTTLHTAIEGVCPVVRCMPNTPALVSKGVFALCFEDPSLKMAQKEMVLDIFGYLGLPLEMPEKSFAAFSALIGAGPAYIFTLMDALVQAGVTLGFPREEAKRMVLALVEGSSHMALESEYSLLDLRNQVCSPAGLTIEAINHLERTATRGHLIDAVLAAHRKSKEMEK